MTNFEKIILSAVGALVVVVLAIGAVVIGQQKKISSLSGGAVGNLKQSTPQKAIPPKGSSLAETIKQFAGTVESLSANQLVISTKLVDFSKPKNPDKFKKTDVPMNTSTNDFESIDKKITVEVNEKTAYVGKQLSNLKVGDSIFVDSDKSPYTSDTVVAEKVTSIKPTE